LSGNNIGRVADGRPVTPPEAQVVFAAHTSQAGARAYIGSLGPSRSKFDKESDYNHQLGSMFRDASKSPTQNGRPDIIVLPECG
jgi:hypothetical protein